MAHTPQDFRDHPHQWQPADPFAADRGARGYRVSSFFGEDMLQILRWKDVRRAAQDVETFDSSEQGRVPIPPETDLRPYRQIPIETNPPEHTAWKDLLQRYFRRPRDPKVAPEFEALVDQKVSEALKNSTAEVVSDFALPLQSAALAVLLDTRRDLADIWINWGLHAFRTNGQSDPAKAERFLTFIDDMLNAGRSEPNGLFSYLHTASFDDRPLTRDEKRGICHLALAGGRDTVINAVTGVIAHLAIAPDALAHLKASHGMIDTATEEYFRILSPLPQIGRVCPHGFDAADIAVADGARAALCWASANRDDTVFEDAQTIRLDRKRNPHVAFGAGAHTCLGAPMARLLVSRLLQQIVERVDRIDCVAAEPRQNEFGTPFLFNTFRARFVASRTPPRPKANP